jgi:undecaprenyl-diphosphatase
MGLSPFEAAFLGLIQGLTEFLPVSSDGHLALTEILFDLGASLAFNILLHAGTLIATIVVLRRGVSAVVVEGARALLRPYRFKRSPGARDALVIAVACIPTALIGFGMKHTVEQWTKSPLVVGLGFLVTGMLVGSTRWVRRGRDEVPSLLGALLIGIAQGIAVLPGLSRSGSTISIALWLGVRPDRAFELSMLMSVPAVFGALLVEAPDAALGHLPIWSGLIGATVAMASGALALVLVRKTVGRGHFFWFALWIFPVAIATLALARAWPEF